jgi:hypothetical protein
MESESLAFWIMNQPPKVKDENNKGISRILLV